MVVKTETSEEFVAKLMLNFERQLDSAFNLEKHSKLINLGEMAKSDSMYL